MSRKNSNDSIAPDAGNGLELLASGRTSGESESTSPNGSGSDAASSPPASSPASSSSSPTLQAAPSPSATSSAAPAKAKAKEAQGVVCPGCQSVAVPVYRTIRESKQIVRYRKCSECERNFKTVAMISKPDRESCVG